MTFGYAIFPRYIACFWSFDGDNDKTTGLSIHINGSEFQSVVYQPIEKKQVFIAGLQPDHVYSLAVNIATTHSLGATGAHEESLVNFVETTPGVSICE